MDREIIDLEYDEYMASIDPNHGDNSERYAWPWATLTMLLTAVGAVLVVVWEAGRVWIVAGAGVLLVGRWLWRAVSGYSRGKG
jgi:hypothetical protein